ncbi:MAG: AIR synthase-related protein [Candidatus Bipolaricaulota bacterium]|nr:AIR synthase-related protein [Candidatus Bipolaricaulota bacterium]
MPETWTHLHVSSRPDRGADPVGERVRRQAADFLSIDTGRVTTSKIYSVSPALDLARTDRALAALGNEVSCVVGVGAPARLGFRSFISVDKRPGVTDDEGQTVLTVLRDLFSGAPQIASGRAASRDVYWLERALSPAELGRIAEELVGNPLVHVLRSGPADAYEDPRPRGAVATQPVIEEIALPRDDAGLLRLSEVRLLSLDRAEMVALRDYFDREAVRASRGRRGLPADPTDCELEIVAQTWSEHCKHKEFNALVEFVDRDRGTTVVIDSLFRTYIVAATRVVGEALREWGQAWLLRVFDDNAGVVRIDDDSVFVWKVETHNSPSAIDPYGGAITGILGCNRDPLGTGRGGGRLLFNTDVLCFAPPTYDRPLLPGQLAPRRVFAGVRAGIEDGGNKSGIPTVNGALVFDDRFAGKPLVFCGSGSIAPARVAGAPWWEKRIDAEDRIVVVGGRVGKDGIHGATFSSVHLDEESPRSAVQIGSPLTQKLASDFLEEACARGWVKAATDNGAGGLSSSVGELARITGGAEVDLERVPLKYEGIQPWEIFLSESQERMTLAVDPAVEGDLLALARERGVEAVDIGRFTEDGALWVRHSGRTAACLDLDFLHHGAPRKRLAAEWSNPPVEAPAVPDVDLESALLGVLGSWNVCSREGVIRQYDHEVKGRTVIKPLMGRGGGPQDAAVLRLSWSDYRGIAVSNGIAPQYGDLDPYAMCACAFDEAVRGIVAVGGRLPGPDTAAPQFWSVNDNFCLPNVAYDARTNPDGRRRLGQLVRMCQALYDIAVAYAVPLTSGKDSMKNDFTAGGVTISIPPTVLFSATAGIPDVRKTVTTGLQAPGDAIYVIGETQAELGGSEFFRWLGLAGGTAPQVRAERARDRYRCVGEAIAAGLVASCHDLSDGGLAVALVESAIGGGLGFDVVLDGLGPSERPWIPLFSESSSRFVVTVPEEKRRAFEGILGRDAWPIGRVTGDARVRISAGGRPCVEAPLVRFETAWRSGLEGYG